MKSNGLSDFNSNPDILVSFVNFLNMSDNFTISLSLANLNVMLVRSELFMILLTLLAIGSKKFSGIDISVPVGQNASMFIAVTFSSPPNISSPILKNSDVYFLRFVFSNICDMLVALLNFDNVNVISSLSFIIAD